MIADRIRQARETKGFTMGQLTLLCGFGKNTLRDEEYGLVEPYSKTLAKIADATDVSMDWLLERSEKMENRRKTSGSAGERFNQVLKEKNMSRKQLSDKSGVSETVFTCFSVGKSIRSVNLIAIADTLGISADWLFGRSSKKYL